MKKIIKRTAIALLCVIGFILLVVIGYVIYMLAAYKRQDAVVNLTVTGATEVTAAVQKGVEYSIVTYNVGFGAYNHDFSFFMDGGKMSKAKDKETVLANTKGASDTLDAIDADFMFLQEVDVKATRSRKVDMLAAFDSEFAAFQRSFAYNYDSPFLFYPIFDPHGAVKSGIATFSRFRQSDPVRYRLTIDEGLFAKFFDLDRCIMTTYVEVEGTDARLALINLHLSAYDEGGKIRAKQLEELEAQMEKEKLAGNYVILGGDFNHDLRPDVTFPSGQERPDWVQDLPADFPGGGYSIKAGGNAPTCRSTDLPYTEKDGGLFNYNVVIDGFIVSDNITAVEVRNYGEHDFLYSDHNPAVLTFRLD